MVYPPLGGGDVDAGFFPAGVAGVLVCFHDYSSVAVSVCFDFDVAVDDVL